MVFGFVGKVVGHESSSPLEFGQKIFSTDPVRSDGHVNQQPPRTDGDIGSRGQPDSNHTQGYQHRHGDGGFFNGSARPRCRVAVCLSGHIRSFAYPVVHRSIRTNLVEAIQREGCEVDVFAYATALEDDDAPHNKQVGDGLQITLSTRISCRYKQDQQEQAQQRASTLGEA